MTCAASSTGVGACSRLPGARSVWTQPGQTEAAVAVDPASIFDRLTVTLFGAVFELWYAGMTTWWYGDPGSIWCASDPIVLTR